MSFRQRPLWAQRFLIAATRSRESHRCSTRSDRHRQLKKALCRFTVRLPGVKRRSATRDLRTKRLSARPDPGLPRSSITRRSYDVDRLRSGTVRQMTQRVSRRPCYSKSSAMLEKSQCKPLALPFILIVHWSNTMTSWTEKLRLKEMAEEDIYFARRDRELINDLRKRRAAKRDLPDQRAREKASRQ